MKTVRIGSLSFGPRAPLALLAGPCVIESREKCLAIAASLARWSRRAGVPLVFKASFDKANRSSVDAFRGPGIDKGLDILREVKDAYSLPIVTDIHEPWQAARAAEVADILQIPAFLCRQTDLLLAAGDTGCVVNVKKAQFLAAEDMAQVVAKVESTGNRRILLTERGTMFGYRNLVVDMRNLLVLRTLGYPVVFDATHSVQRPGTLGGSTGGDSRYVPALARAAVATGAVDALFAETHPNPAEALSDKANALPLARLPSLWRQLLSLDAVARRNPE